MAQKGLIPVLFLSLHVVKMAVKHAIPFFAHEQFFWQPLMQLHDIALSIDIGQAGPVAGQGTAFP